VDTQLADSCALTEHREYHIFLPSLTQACPSHAKSDSEFSTLSNEVLSPKGDSTDNKNTGSLGLLGVGLGSQPNPEKLFVAKCEEKVTGHTE
jgi:hypothetical protein